MRGISETRAATLTAPEGLSRADELRTPAGTGVGHDPFRSPIARARPRASPTTRRGFPPPITSHSPALRLFSRNSGAVAGGSRRGSNLGKARPAGLEEIAMHADQAVLAAVHALAQSPLRPGVLDDVTDLPSFASR